MFWSVNVWKLILPLSRRAHGEGTTCTLDLRRRPGLVHPRRLVT